MRLNSQMLSRALKLVVPLCLAGAAHAEVQTFFYVGNAFSSATPGHGLTRVTIRADIDMSRVQANSHVVVDSYNAGGLVLFAFRDGFNTITNDRLSGWAIYSSASMSFDTGADRSISGNWQAIGSRAHGGPMGVTLYDTIATKNLTTGLVMDTAYSLNRYSASVTNDPGVWSTTSVPEPPAALLAGLGLSLLVLRVKYRTGGRASAAQ